MHKHLLALALLASSAGTVTAGGSPARVRSDPPDDRLDRELTAIQAFAEQFTGLKFKTDVLVRRLSVDQYRANRAKKYADTKAARQREWRILLALGLIENATDAEALYEKFLLRSVAGFYDFDTGHVVLPAGARDESTTLAHELVHAVQAQHLGLKDVLDGCKGDDDREMAVRAVMEGTAVLAEKVFHEQWRETKDARPTRELLAQVVREADAQIATAYRRAARLDETVIRFDSFFPYTFGVRWVASQALADPDRLQATLRALYRPERCPRSTRQVMAVRKGVDADKLVLDLKAATGPWAKEKSYKVIEDGRLGELYCRMWLVPDTLAERPGDAGGTPVVVTADRFVALDNGTEIVGAGVLVFDSAAQAKAAQERIPIGRLARNEKPPATRRGGRVLVVAVGPAPAELLDAVADAAGKVALPPPADPTGILRGSFRHYLTGPGGERDGRWDGYLADVRGHRDRGEWVREFAGLLFGDLDPSAADDRPNWAARDAVHSDLGVRAAGTLPAVLSGTELAEMRKVALDAAQHPDTLPVPRLNAVRWLLATADRLTPADREQLVAAAEEHFAAHPALIETVTRALTRASNGGAKK